MALELTEREIALCKGENPEAPEVTDEAVGTEAEIGNEQEALEGGTDAPGQSNEDDEQEVVTETPGNPESQDADWVDGEAELAGSYGLTKDDLRSFSSQEDFRRAVRLIDRNFSQPAKPATQEEKKPEEVKSAESVVDIDPDKLAQEGYDEQTIAIAKAAKEAREESARIKAELESFRESAKFLKDQHEKQVRDAQREAYHAAVDKLNPDLFGKRRMENGQRVEVSKDHAKNRDRLLDAAETIAAGIYQRAVQNGVQPQMPSPEIMLQRAMNYAFGQELAELEKKKFQERVVAQSKTRRPAAGSRASLGGSGSRGDRSNVDEAKEVANSPEVVKLWKKFTQENGTE